MIIKRCAAFVAWDGALPLFVATFAALDALYVLMIWVAFGGHREPASPFGEIADAS
jgi:hypothetical protein